MRCAPNAMDTETVKQIREFTREANAEFIQHRRTSTITEYCEDEYEYEYEYEATDYYDY